MKYAVLVVLFVLFIGTVQAAEPFEVSKLVCAHWNEWEAIGDIGTEGLQSGFSIGAMLFVGSPRTITIAGFRAEMVSLCREQPGMRLARAARLILARR